MDFYAIILAAGKGTRMQCDDLPKCANKIIDKPMVLCVYDALKKNNINNIVTVVGYQKEKIIEILKGKSDFVYQMEQKGTGHAVNMARTLLNGKKGITVIAAGDMPLIKWETFKNLLDTHLKTKSDLTVMTAIQENPSGYGRIIRNNEGFVEKIVEEKDCNDEERKIKEVNAAVYVVDNEKLFGLIDHIDTNNSQHEYYLTDIVATAKKENLQVSAYVLEDNIEMQGVNTKEQLMALNKIVQNKIIEKHIENGVIFEDKENVVIGLDVLIEPGTKIYSNEVLTGNLKISKQRDDLK